MNRSPYILKHVKRRLVWVPVPIFILIGFYSPKLFHKRQTISTTPYKLVYPSYFGNKINVPSDNPLTEEGVRLGRMLFYDPILSRSPLMSCGTCHQQKRAFTDGKRFSSGVAGTDLTRNTPSLTNVLWMRHFFWDGRASSLEEQAVFPLTQPDEMGQSLEQSAARLRSNWKYPALFKEAFGTDSITGKHIVKALGQFQRTLISSNSRYDQYLRGDYVPTASETSGIRLFFTNPDPARKIRGAGCANCHGGPRQFSDTFHNNGLDSLFRDQGRAQHTSKKNDQGKFRVATLRNIALTGPYMHDGRFRTLQEVIDHYNDHIIPSGNLSPLLRKNFNQKTGNRLGLSVKEKQDILAFLHLLTDSTFITDKRFSDPSTD